MSNVLVVDEVPQTFFQYSRSEKSTLLYLETCAVDGCGRVVSARMNEEDFVNIKRFQNAGLIDFGRLPFKVIDKIRHGSVRLPPTHWVKLYDEGWRLAGLWRRERAERNYQYVEKI